MEETIDTSGVDITATNTAAQSHLLEVRPSAVNATPLQSPEYTNSTWVHKDDEVVLSQGHADADDDSEHTDDELSDTSVEASNEEFDVINSEIFIFEYNDGGLTRKSHLSLGDGGLAEDSSDRDTEEFTCHSCDKVCPTWASFRIHLRSHSKSDTLACPLCQKTFQAKSLVERHIRAFHNKEKPYLCRFCGRGFSTEWYCQKHEGHHKNGTGPRIAARDRKNICQFCWKEFPKLKQLQMHEATHTGEKNFSCSHCYKTFCYSSSLLKHLKSMHSDEPTLCVHCDKTFSTAESLLKHQEYHVGMNQYKCRWCNLIFPDMLSLKRHGRTDHYNEIDRSHACEYCDKRFSQKSILEAHLRCHTGEKPFLCLQCGKTFRQKSQLKTHLRCHSTDRPFSCSTCGKSFTASSMLQRHIETHSGVKKNTCTICQESFPSKLLLSQHENNHKCQPKDKAIEVDVNTMSQDEEIMGLALKSFVHSMSKSRNGNAIDPSTFDDGADQPHPGQRTLSNVAEKSSPGTSRADSTNTAVPVVQSSITTEIEMDTGSVGVLPVAIEENIQTTIAENTKEGDSCGVSEEVQNQSEVDSLLEGGRSVDQELDIDEMQVLDDVTPTPKEAQGLDVNLRNSSIAQSIFENPNMEKIRQKYSRKPQIVESLLVTSNANDLEIKNALMRLGVSSSEEGGQVNNGSQQPPDPAEESEATDDEVDDDLCVNKPEHKQEKFDKEKVFESLSIFEFTDNGLVCIRKVDMFEPKFHRKCARCSKSFFSLCGYENHMRRHDSVPELPYVCQYCGRGFASKMSVVAHEAVHTGETLYKCKFCPKEFRNYSSHRVHTATHSKLKPYFCRFCSRPFAQVAHVQRHERTHTGSRPYACKFCDKAFAEWGTWQRHTRIHTGERPYGCPTCGKGFIVKFSLTRHMKSHEKDSMRATRQHQMNDGGDMAQTETDSMNDSVASGEITLLIDEAAINLMGGGEHIVFDQKQGEGSLVLNQNKAGLINDNIGTGNVTVLIDG